MKKYLYSTLLLLLCSVTGAFAQSMTITGGNDHGVIICSQGYLYAWGLNMDNTIGGPLLGIDPQDPETGSFASDKYVYLPGKVKTDGLTFSQVTAGSGAFTLALSCHGVVYAWGDNQTEACGQGGTFSINGNKNVVPYPIPVLKGDADGYEENGDKGGPYLGGVVMIAANTVASFALLEDGRVVSWGKDNWNNNIGLPEFVKDCNGQDITNVTHISGGDHNCYFRTSDGSLYAVGTWNGDDNDAGVIKTKCATKVLKAEDGKPLENIRMSAAGDQCGFAVTADGFLWGWGNTWGGCPGIGPDKGGMRAQKVISGAYQSISGEAYLTDVTQVIGGRGHGAAITKEGYLLFWGSNDQSDGGVAPDPMVKKGQQSEANGSPVFAFYCKDGTCDVRGDTVKDAVAISRGDNFDFMVNDKDEYYAWGLNDKGQLGVGNGSYADSKGNAPGLPCDVHTCLSKIQTIPCEIQDVCPSLFMVDVNKCPGEEVELDCGYVVPIGKEDRYYIEWYFNDKKLNTSDLKKGNNDEFIFDASYLNDAYNASSILVTQPGKYKVVAYYVGGNVPCGLCVPDTVEIEVVDMDMPIDTIITNMNCVANPDKPSAGDRISFEAVVNDKFYKATDNVTFAAFSTPTSTDTIRIVKTTGAGGVISLPFISGDSVLQVNDNAATTGDTTYSIWLEDITSFETKLLETKAPDAASCSGNYYGSFTQILNLPSSSELKSFSLYAVGKQAPQIQDGVIQDSNYATLVVTPLVYKGGMETNSGYELGGLFWTGEEQSFKLYQPDGVQECVVKCDVKLPANSARGSQYLIAIKFELKGNGGYYVGSLGSGSSVMYPTVYEDSKGFGITAIGSTANGFTTANGNRNNPFWNITFGKLTDYDCGRIELQARLGCPPCNQPDPTTVKITVSDPTVTDTIFLCQESPAVTLSVSGVKGAPSAEAGAKFDILWYDNSLATNAVKTDLEETSSTYPASITWNASKAGTTEKIYLQVRDSKEPNGDCHEEDSIVIKYNKIPKAPTIAVPSFCENAAVTDKPVIASILGNSFDKMTLQWWADDAMAAPSTAPDFSTLLGSATKYPFYYNIIDANNCVSPVDSFLVEVYQKPVAPTVKNLDFVVTPTTTEKVEQGATATTGHTLTWYDDANKSSYPTQGSATSPTVTLDAEKKESFWVAQISDDGGCISDTVRIDVTVNDAPVPDAVNDTVCLGISVDVTKLVTVGDQRNPNDRYVPVWYNDFGANKEDSVSASAVMMDPNNPGEQLFYVAQKNLATGAISNKKTFAVYVYGVYKPTVDKSVINYCAKDPATVLTANQMKNENDGYMADDFVWTLDGRGVNSPLPDTDVTNDTSYTYRVHQIYTIPTDQNQVCVGDSVEVTVNVTHVPQLTVGSVLYLKSDANASGSFDNNLMQQNTGLITGNMEQGATLNWYESDCATPVPGTPTPMVDSSIPTGVDQNVTYCVSQTVNGCEGEKIKVDVKISDAMPPTVEHLIYCEGSVIEDLAAKVSTLPGENESDFELLWYRNQPADVNAAYDYYCEATGKFAMNSQIASVTNSAVTVTSYWVAQRNKSTQAVSTATELKVIVYPKPVVITTAPDAICGNDGNVLELNANPAIWSVANEADLKANSIATITPQFFDGQGNSLGASSAVNASGTYSIGATYNVTSTLGGVNIKDNTCTGDPVQVAVQVHYLSDLSITGVNSTCPSTTVTLTASATSTDPGVISYVWGGDGAGATGDTYTTPTLTERINNQGTQIPYSYTVQATAGKCVLDVATPHEVVIGDGPVIGNMTIAETGNSEAPITFTGDVPREFYSCGGEVMLTVDFTKTAGDYTWFDENGNQVGTGATYTVPATQFTVDRKYRLEYTNQCPTFTEVTIKAVPLTAKALQKGDIVLCEGEPFMVSMEYACLENPSIQWYRDGSMIGSIEKEMKIEKTIVSDGGLYSFVAKNRGCTVSDTAYNLVVKPYIQVTDIADPLVIARGGNQSITLPITVPANGLVQSISWKENGAEVYNGNPYTLTDVRADHYYDIFLDDPNHCSDTTEITVWVDAELQLSTTLKDTICLGATETLVIDTTGTGAFRQFNVTPSLIVTEESDGNIMDITDKIQKVGNLLNIPVAPKANTTYKVEFSYGNQFVSSTEFAVVIPAIEVTTPAIPTICEGEQVKLQVTDIKPIGTSVSWVSDPTIIDGQNSEILTVQPVYTGGVNHQSVYVYTLMATNSICGTSKPYEVKVKVDEPITGNITGVNAICEGQSTVLDASSFQAGTYSWSTNGSAVGVMDVINVSPAATATYELSMTRGLCSASASYTVLVSTNPVIMRIDSVALRDREIILDPSYGTAPFTYAIDSREPDVNSIKENLSFTSHIAKVVDAAGCQTSVQFSMEPPAITIPEHFSPNGDGINDTWVCPSLADVYPNSLVSIYDRYGKLLVQFLGADAEGWDGTYMGVDMPSTDYWYQIDIEEINRQYVGHFTLIRR